MKLSKYNLLVPSNDDDQYILFNTFNGNCMMISPNVAHAIEQNNLESFTREDTELFTQTGVLIQNNVEEDKIYFYMHSREKHASTHLAATVLLTESCNLRCTYCFQGHDTSSMTMDVGQADRFISFLTSSAKINGSKHVSVLLFGGEPLVNIEIGFYILSKVKEFCEQNEMMFSSSIITNGTLLNENIINKLHEFNCKMIQVTLDGVKEIHDTRRMFANGKGSFDDTIDALKLLKDNGKIHTVVRVNIDKTNLQDTYQLLEYLGRSGIDLTKFTVDFGIVRGETSACAGYSSKCLSESEIGDVLYDFWSFAEKQGFKYKIRPMRKTMYCGLYSNNQFTVAPNCDVYKCWEHVGQKEHLMGRIDDNGNLSNLTYAFYDWMSVDPLKNEECSECVYLPVCGGGCGVVSYNESGTYHSKGCFKIKGTVEKQVLKYVEDMTSTNIDSQNNCTCEGGCGKSDS